MIELFTANTSNGIKIPIALEELRVPYMLRKLPLGGSELRSSEFLEINPNAKIPAIRHHIKEPDSTICLFESGAILLYLAETFGGLIGSSRVARAQTFSWLFLQVAGLGPAMGNTAHFRSLQNRDAYALARFEGEAARHLKLLDQRLTEVPWLNGESYSIADIAHFSWVRNADYAGFTLQEYPALRSWVELIEKRPATGRARAKLV